MSVRKTLRLIAVGSFVVFVPGGAIATLLFVTLVRKKRKLVEHESKSAQSNI